MQSHYLAERLERIAAAIRDMDDFYLRPNVMGEDGLAIVVRQHEATSPLLKLELSPYNAYNAAVWTPEDHARLEAAAEEVEIQESLQAILDSGLTGLGGIVEGDVPFGDA